jgi:hypothetical protein
MDTHDKNHIYPGDLNNINYWTNKLGINTRKLYDAILYTGSTNVEDIKNYLKTNTSSYYTPFGDFWQSIKNKMIFLN